MNHRQLADDLAFMRSMAEDKDPLPSVFGVHLVAPGLIFAPGPLMAWAAMTGRLPFSGAWIEWLWAINLAIYIPVVLLINRFSCEVPHGPNRRAFGAAWASMGAMTFTLIGCLYLASANSDAQFFGFWPCIAFAMYGGAWFVIWSMTKRAWHGLIALGCFASALACAFLVNTPEQWLALGVGLLVWFCGPGIAIMLSARRARSA